MNPEHIWLLATFGTYAFGVILFSMAYAWKDPNEEYLAGIALGMLWPIIGGLLFLMCFPWLSVRIRGRVKHEREQTG